MKIVNVSEPSIGGAMTEDETRNFLSNNKWLARMGSIDKEGDPNVHPVWYYFDNDKIYFETHKLSKKARNIKNKNTIYFCIDDDNEPYRGVRGKGHAVILQDKNKSRSILEKMLIKYTGSLDNKIAKFLLSFADKGESVVFEITPKYFATWDHSKGLME